MNLNFPARAERPPDQPGRPSTELSPVSSFPEAEISFGTDLADLPLKVTLMDWMRYHACIDRTRMLLAQTYELVDRHRKSKEFDESHARARKADLIVLRFPGPSRLPGAR